MAQKWHKEMGMEIFDFKKLIESAHTEEEWLEMFRGLPISERRKYQAQLKAKGLTPNSAPPWGRIMQEEIPPPIARKGKKK